MIRRAGIGSCEVAAICWAVCAAVPLAPTLAAPNDGCKATRLPDDLRTSTGFHLAIAKAEKGEWVAWSDRKLHLLYRPQGGEWRRVGGFDALQVDGEPRLVARPGQDPVLAFMAGGQDRRTRLRVYSLGANATHVPYGEPLISGESGRSVLDYSLSVTKNGLPVVVWTELEGARTHWLFVAEWTGHGWSTLGKRSLEVKSGILGESGSAIDSDGSVWVVSSFLERIAHIGALRLRDGAWTEVPVPANVSRVSDARIVVAGGVVFYAWQSWKDKRDVRVHVAEFKDGRWHSRPVDVEARTFDLGAADGLPLLAWGPPNSAGEVRVLVLSAGDGREHVLSMGNQAGQEKIENGDVPSDDRSPVHHRVVDQQGHVEPASTWPVVIAISAGAGGSVVGWVTQVEGGKNEFQYVDLVACDWYH